jgi:hypothetical protein
MTGKSLAAIQPLGAGIFLLGVMMFKQDDRPGLMSEMLLQEQFTSILAMSFYDNIRSCPSFIPFILLWPPES